MKRKLIFLSPLILILLLVFLLIGAVFIPGLIPVLLKIGDRFAPGTLTYEQAEGALAGPLRISGLSYLDGDTSISIGQISLDWHPQCLVQQKLCLDRLHLDQVEVRIPAATEDVTDTEEQAEPFQLPDIELPFAFRLTDIVIRDLTVWQNDQLLLPLEHFSVSVSGEEGAVSLAELLVRQGNTHLTLAGQVRPQEDYPFSFDLDWAFDTTDFPFELELPEHLENISLKGQGQLSGDMQQMQVQHQLRGDVELDLVAQLNQPLDDLSWVVSLDQLKLDLALIDPSRSESILSGRLDTQGSLEKLDLQTELAIWLVETGQVNTSLDAAISVTGEQLQLTALNLTLPETDSSINLSGSVQSWTQPDFDLLMEWSGLQLPLQPVEEGAEPFISEAGTLKLAGKLDGDLLAAQAELATQVDETGVVQLLVELNADLASQWLAIQTLSLDLPDAAMQLELQGEISNWAEPDLVLSGNWKNLYYPIFSEVDEAQLFASPEGEFSLKGSLDDYDLALKTRVSGEQIPTGEWQFSGSGNQEALRSLTLAGNLLDGQLLVEGSAAWLAQPAWDLQVELQDINPGVHWPEWEGDINLKLISTGKLVDGIPQLSATIEEFRGEMRDQVLQGQGDISLAGENLQIDALSLSLGGANLQASGSIEEQIALAWSLSIPDLSQALPTASGQLTAVGAVAGSREMPRISASLEGDNLTLEDQARIERLNGSVKLDFSGDSESDINIELLSIHAAGQAIDRVLLQGQGTPLNHRLELSIAGKPLDLDLAATGRWDDISWAGTLDQLSVFRTEAGRWELVEPVPVTVEPPAFTMGRTCLQQLDRSGRLCARTEVTKDGAISGAADLRSLSLAMIEPWLNGATIDSMLEMDAEFSVVSGQPVVDAVISTTPGTITTIEQRTLNIGRTETRAIIRDDNMNVSMSALLDDIQGSIKAELEVSALSAAQTLEGELEIRLADLEIISVFAPQIQNIAGLISGRFIISGDAASPRVNGAISYLEGGAELPAQGIILSDIEMTVRTNVDQVDLLLFDGRLTSGDGTINLAGQFDLTALTGNIELAGENFTAMHTRDIHVLISPDLEVVISDEDIRLGGSLTVPFARISPPELSQSAVSSSSDVVIVGSEEEEAGVGLPIRTNLRLVLGDSVEVDAFGFKGRLIGSLNVIDEGVDVVRATGSIQVESGQYRLYGQDLNIQRGGLIYTGGPIDNPGFDMLVSRHVEDVEAGARVQGTLRQPDLTLYSVPAMPDSSILSYLILGRGPGSTSSAEQSMMMQAAMAMGMQGGNAITDQLRDNLSLDELGFDTNAGGESAFFIGKYLTPRLYIRYGIGLLESVDMLMLSYQLTSRWKIESQSSSVGSGADVLFTLER
ncbi:translocation/assembly module TamB domain-containing protein [Nitrincola sp. MINF-07-Sa-05]|uniref:translocation/assembly module TamB domain-containing protein n=1 Tax=Nitrincola salilacus TaxID=3400273 RepID=UPI003917F1C1